MNFTSRVHLGQTDLAVSRVGIGPSYGIDCASLLEAFDGGINYFYFGTLRTDQMARAVHQLSASHRNELVVAVQSYARWPSVLQKSVGIALRKLKLSHADVLILGKVDSPLSHDMQEQAVKLRNSGAVRYLAVSSHHRTCFSSHLNTGIFDILMIRYNAAHTGAERQVFPLLPAQNRPGTICFTATRWGTLLRGIPGERAPTALDCYRFVLSHPAVDMCLTGPKNSIEMRAALRVLGSTPMSEEEGAWMRKVGATVRHRKHHNWLLQRLVFD